MKYIFFILVKFFLGVVPFSPFKTWPETKSCVESLRVINITAPLSIWFPPCRVGYIVGFIYDKMSVERDLISPSNVLDLNKGAVARLPSHELATENDKANDKLVDLVSMLTNKINKNVKEIQVDIIDHYEENYRKLEDLDSLGSDRVVELSRKVEERIEANKVLRAKIVELQSKQKSLQENFVNLDRDIGDLTSQHEQSSARTDQNLEKHAKRLTEFEVREQRNREQFEENLKQLKADAEETFANIQADISKKKDFFNDTIKANVAEQSRKNESVNSDFVKINEKLDVHKENHSKKRDELLKTAKNIDDLIERTNEKFREAEKDQMSNDNTHESLKDLIGNHYQHCEETIKNFKQKIVFIEKELKENVLQHDSFSQVIKETDVKLRFVKRQKRTIQLVNHEFQEVHRRNQLQSGGNQEVDDLV